MVAMVKLEPKLDADAVNALLRRAFPDADHALMPRVTELEPGRLHMVSPYREGILRPGVQCPQCLTAWYEKEEQPEKPH